MTTNRLREFYPETSPLAEHRIKVSDLHTVYAAAYGNPQGIPVAVLHGGPGSGTSPYFAQFFNPEKYYIILMDQRGAGKSTPSGEMRDNTTPLLIQDIETIRQFFKIDKWAVFGGSWGSSLALLYAEAHPDKVLSLILRGIFLVRKNDISAFIRNDCPAAMLHHQEWEDFKSRTTHLIEQANMSHLSVEKEGMYHIYYELLQHNDPEFCDLAARTLSGWERFNSSLIPDHSLLDPENNASGANTALTEATFFENECHIKPNQILNDIAKLQGLPVYIVQGIYDLVCPAYMADELEQSLRRVNQDVTLITRINCLAGHTHKDAAIRDGLITASDDFAAKYLNHQEHEINHSPRTAMRK